MQSSMGKESLSTRPIWLLLGIGAIGLALCIGTIALQRSVSSCRAGDSECSVRLPSQRPTMVAGDMYAGLPLIFERNEGQTDSRIDFLARGPGYAVFLAPTEAVLSLAHAKRQGSAIRPSFPLPVACCKASVEFPGPIIMKLAGASPRTTKTGLEELPGKVNYFVGNEPDKWRTNVLTYAKIKYHSVYPGVDLVYYGSQHQLEYDFVVDAGIDPKVIALVFQGTETLEIDGRGDLLLQIAGDTDLRLRKPVAYQEVNGSKQAVSVEYRIDGQHIGFELGAYDQSLPLVIDPVLVYSTYLGGSDDDAGYGIAVDRSGNVYVTGETTSADFPLANSLQRAPAGNTDVFVAKLNADGSRLLFSTYLGGRSADVGYGIALDAEGNAYLTGDTRSIDFPLVGAFQTFLAGASDVFVAKLRSDGGQLVYSTYIGGRGGERGLGIAVDTSGNAYVTGFTNSTDFPVVNALQPRFAGGNADAFVLKLNSTGSALIYSTYLGGGNDRPDIGTAIAVDSDGNAYVTGFTNSADFPTVRPLQPFRGPTDAFVTKLNANGSAFVYSTHLGGSADDESMAIAVDASGNAYVTGHTESLDFPTTAGALSTKCAAVRVRIPIGDICSGGDAFISKLSADGSALVHSTYLSGRGFEVGRGIAVDAAGNVYVTGFTGSVDFPTANPLQKAFGGGDFDAFVVMLDASLSKLRYSTYLGGSGNDGGYAVAVDNKGNAYVTGFASSPDFPLQNPLRNSIQRPSRGVRHAFVTKIAAEVASE